MTEEVRTHLREEVAKFWPHALKAAIKKYRQFIEEEYTDASDFKKRQEACKVAVGHIELLMKLEHAGEKNIPDSGAMSREELSLLMQNAHAEVEAYNERKRQKQKEKYSEKK